MQDNNITEEVAQRRRELFNQYVSPYLNIIYGLCIRYTFNSSNLKDNYNEALIRLYKYIETYDNSMPIRTWLHVVTKNCVFALDSKRSKINNNNEDYYADKLTMNDEEDIYILESSNYEENEYILELSNYTEVYSDDIYSALESLTTKRRDTLLLHQAGYKCHEIADIEYNRGHLKNHSVASIKERLFSARECLRESLIRDGKRRVTY